MQQSTSYSKQTQKDDLYLEDEALEGSGSNQEVKSDLESSGSGYGPDDEDGDQGSGADRESVLCVDNAHSLSHIYYLATFIHSALTGLEGNRLVSF